MTKERAVGRESAVARAENGESAASEERAVDAESTSPEERAVGRESTVL